MCNFLVHLQSKNCSVKIVVVRKLDAKMKELTLSVCPEDRVNKWYIVGNPFLVSLSSFQVS